MDPTFDSSLDPVVVGIARAVLVWVFASAAFHKLRAPAAFASIVRGYRLVPDGSAPAIAWLLGAVEAVTAVALLWPGRVWAGAAAALGLLALY